MQEQVRSVKAPGNTYNSFLDTGFEQWMVLRIFRSFIITQVVFEVVNLCGVRPEAPFVGLKGRPASTKAKGRLALEPFFICFMEFAGWSSQMASSLAFRTPGM